jgi:hypothetical protein
MAMARAAAGRREINPAFSSVKIIWCTVGGVTRKKRAMSDCAGGRPFTNVGVDEGEILTLSRAEILWRITVRSIHQESSVLEGKR